MPTYSTTASSDYYSAYANIPVTWTEVGSPYTVSARSISDVDARINDLIAQVYQLTEKMEKLPKEIYRILSEHISFDISEEEFITLLQKGE